MPGNVVKRHETGDWLDVLPKLIVRSQPGPPAPPLPTEWPSPIILMGLVSATQPRRDVLRCTWVKTLRRTGAARVLFIIGVGAPDVHSSDVLPTPFGERLQLGRRKISGVSSYSTYSLYAKTMHFLKHAASQPEPVIVLGDDDVFLQPHALLGYTMAIIRASRRHDSPLGANGGEWYAGRFDWYSWRTETMQATAYWRGLRGALYGAQEWYRNCSPTGAGWIRSGAKKLAVREAPAEVEPPHERCVGPFAFAKGPLVMLSAPVVRWVVASAAFSRDVARAASIASGLKPRGRSVERVPQDVQLGYWLTQHPTLRYISLPRKTGWADAFEEVTDLRRLLIGHRIPWDQLAWLTTRTERLWSRSRAMSLTLRCAGAPCPPGQCSHARTQVSCATELLLPDPATNRSSYTDGEPTLVMGCHNCRCWEGSGPARITSGGACNFSRTYVPRIPEHCLEEA